MIHQSFRHYVLGTVQIGIGFGVVSVIARWVTGNTILASPESIVKYGIFGGIGYALMGAFALMSFGWLAKRVRQHCPDGMTIGDFLFHKLRPIDYWLMMLIFLAISVNGLLMQGKVAGMLFTIFFDWPEWTGLLIFFLFCALFAGIGGTIWIHRLAIVQVIIMFSAVMIIPVYFFIQEGVEMVYNGIRLYHPYLLVLHHYDAWFYIGTGILIGFGQVLTDLPSWQRAYIIEETKLKSTYLLSGIIWSIFPLAFSSFFMIVIYTGGFDNLFSLWSDLTDKMATPFLFALFSICAFSAITSTFGAMLHALISLLIKNVYQVIHPHAAEERKLKIAYRLAVFLCALSFFYSVIATPAMGELLFFLGNMYAAIIAPILALLFAKRGSGNGLPVFAILGMGAGYLMQDTVGMLMSVWISMAVSSSCVILQCVAFRLGK